MGGVGGRLAVVDVAEQDGLVEVAADVVGANHTFDDDGAAIQG